MQVIALTEELLATARQNEISGTDSRISASESPVLPHSKGNEKVTGMFFILLFHSILVIF